RSRSSMLLVLCSAGRHRSGDAAPRRLGGRPVDGKIFADDHAIIGSGRGARHHAELHIFEHAQRLAPAWIAEAAPTRHFDEERLAFRHGLLSLAAQLGAGSEAQHAGRAVPAAVAAAGREMHAVVIGADAERRIVEAHHLHHLTEPAAILAGTAGIYAIFLAP